MKQYVLVAGVDYEFKGVNFRIFVDNRMKRIMALNKTRDDLKFHIFDFRSGEYLTNTVTYTGGKKSEKKATVTTLKSITKANYTTRPNGSTVFKDGQIGTMSVLDVYAIVQSIGSSDAGTLMELSLFSHAFMGGPILVNSDDDGQLTIPDVSGTPLVIPLAANERDPDDMDPRAPKDFTPPNMDAADLKHFQDAFHTDGFIWIWGCAFPRVLHEILHKIETNKAYKSSGLADSVMFTFTNFGADHFALVQRYHTAMKLPVPASRSKVEMEFKYLKHFVCLFSAASFSQQIAAFAKVKTFGAPLGTYSDYDTGGSLPLMSVYSGFTRHFAFYKNYLGFTFDPEGRHYAEFKPGFACTKPAVPPPPGP